MYASYSLSGNREYLAKEVVPLLEAGLLQLQQVLEAHQQEVGLHYVVFDSPSTYLDASGNSLPLRTHNHVTCTVHRMHRAASCVFGVNLAVNASSSWLAEQLDYGLCVTIDFKG
jgi:hypothetical protein